MVHTNIVDRFQNSTLIEFVITGGNMVITVEHEGDAIWVRDTESNQGTSCTAYTKDDTQEKIIAALESALEQAKGELLCRND